MLTPFPLSLISYPFSIACPQGSGHPHSLFLFCHPERSRGAFSKTKKSSNNAATPHAVFGDQAPIVLLQNLQKQRLQFIHLSVAIEANLSRNKIQ
jgi:hypothetical protein